jgi:SAM-dependent methyltransferase
MVERILTAACSNFQHVTGIDVHRSNDPVKRKLNESGFDNYVLHTTDGTSIPNDTNSLDFVYSYIVLMHIPGMELFRHYIAETIRVLRPGGVAQLFYGRYSRMSWKARLRWYLPGYREITKAQTNYTSLVITKRIAHKLARNAGFKIIDSGSSLRPDGIQKGIQNYMTLQMPE